jgi:hypothetical protein
MVGNCKNKRRTAENLKNFPQLLGLSINVNRSAAPQRKGIEIATSLSSLLLADRCYLGIYQWHSSTL